MTHSNGARQSTRGAGASGLSSLSDSTALGRTIPTTAMPAGRIPWANLFHLRVNTADLLHFERGSQAPDHSARALGSGIGREVDPVQ